MVVDKLLLEHVELTHDLDLAVHLVYLGGYGQPVNNHCAPPHL